MTKCDIYLVLCSPRNTDSAKDLQNLYILLDVTADKSIYTLSCSFPDTLCLVLSPSSFLFFTLSGPLGTWNDPGLGVWRTPWGLAWPGVGPSWSRPQSSCRDRLRLVWGRAAGPPRCAGLLVRAWHQVLQGWRWAEGACVSLAAAGAPSPLFPRCPLWRHQRDRSVSVNGPATAGKESPYERCHSCSLSACGNQRKVGLRNNGSSHFWFSFLIRL